MPVQTARERFEARLLNQKRTDEYLAHVAAGDGRLEAAKKAGFTGRKRRSPRPLIEAPELRRRMQVALRAKGGGVDRIAEVLVDAMGAKTQASFQGEITESEYPDHKVRVQAVKAAAEFMGLGEKESVAGSANIVNIIVPSGVAHLFASNAKVVDGVSD